MALNSTHPSYAAKINDWQLMRDAYEGEGRIKSENFKYLPATPGQVLDGALKGSTHSGRVSYDAYKLRAEFPDYVAEAVENYTGMLHSKAATFELPKKLEGLLERATRDGESLAALLRRINVEQLTTGRLGIMLDFPTDPKPGDDLPYIATYIAETVRNWDESADGDNVNALNLVVLDESTQVRDPHSFEWTHDERYRVLMLAHPQPVVSEGEGTTPVEPVGPGVYMQGVFSVTEGNNAVNVAEMLVPQYKGTALEELPFIIINANDVVAEPSKPPLLGLARKCLTIYRGEADYRQTLFMQGQDTLVVINGVRSGNDNDAIRIGAGARIDVDVHGDAKFIGTDSAGIPEQRTALENDRKEAEAKAGTLVSPSAGKQESGDALTTRLSAQTASLTQTAKAGALGLQNLLRIAARWMGEDPEKVIVTPNLEFEQHNFSGADVAALMGARTLGAPISFESIHEVMRDSGLTKFDFDTEMDKISEEDAERAKLLAELPQPQLPIDPNKTPPGEEDEDEPKPAPGAPKPAPKA